MTIKMILPALTEAKSPFWRPIKYSLFPPPGLATQAAYCEKDDHIILKDEHVEELDLDVNGSFVFALDDDNRSVFDRTVEWAVKNAFTTCTFHILTPYPGTRLFKKMEEEGRILRRNRDLYDTRHVVYKTTGLSAKDLQNGYEKAYRGFYSWSNVFRASLQHDDLKHMVKHFTYAGGWKKFEPLWNFLIRTGSLNKMLPLLEAVLSKIKKEGKGNESKRLSPFPAIA